MPVGLHRRDRLAAGLVLLRGQDLPRVVERRLDRPRRTSSAYVGDSAVEQLERGERERRQRLVEREVVLQVDGEPHRAALRVRARRAARRRRRPAAPGRSRWRRRMCRRCAGAVSWLSVSRCRIAAKASPGPGDHVEQHRVGDPEAARSAAPARRRPAARRSARPSRRSPPAASCGPPCGASSGRRRPWPAPSRSRRRARAPARRRSRRCRSRPGRPGRRSGGTRGPSAAGPGCRRTWTAR